MGKAPEAVDDRFVRQRPFAELGIVQRRHQRDARSCARAILGVLERQIEE